MHVKSGKKSSREAEDTCSGLQGHLKKSMHAHLAVVDVRQCLTVTDL